MRGRDKEGRKDNVLFQSLVIKKREKHIICDEKPRRRRFGVGIDGFSYGWADSNIQVEMPSWQDVISKMLIHTQKVKIRTYKVYKV